ncbi:Patatin-like phospholipase/acyl hydrolase [Paenacidovorax caeni]|uniref:Patatin-like phospholipase/acyl hydrolase n=1 Tax=Paenacidovorax caeni TaxID=343013 RepID=A0A1I7I4Z7_9BURK|nr:CBASS cGAMP-activated phospholipase [Paenacidovorax caeni]SFU67992.1 Patatin-like phospholipase/acyl hydrolase [Paenacidovorax caeni]
MATRGSSSEFRILALSGGGYLGLYAAVVLAELEARVGEPLGRRFDLIAGTSVGGLLSMALAFEVPMAELVKLFLERGEEVFSSRRLPTGAVTRLLDLSRSVMGPKYTGEALRKELTRHFGQRTLGDALHAVVVPAVDVTRSVTKVFKTPHAQASLGDAGLSAVDVTMATCAAPAFFPCVKVGDKLYADGGLFAVAPDQVALHEAELFMGAKPSKVRMLSVGTATMGYQPMEKPEADVGAVGWLTDGRLILTMISVQQQHVQAIMEDRLADRYMRLDAPWPAQAGLGIDVATKQAAQTLTTLGQQTLAGLDEERLQKFL